MIYIICESLRYFFWMLYAVISAMRMFQTVIYEDYQKEEIRRIKKYLIENNLYEDDEI